MTGDKPTDVMTTSRSDKFIIIGLIALIYWAAFFGFSFSSDLYLAMPTLGLWLKFAFPVAAAVNLVGLAVGVRRLITRRGRFGPPLLILHGAPLLMALGFGWWLIFGVSI